MTPERLALAAAIESREQAKAEAAALREAASRARAEVAKAIDAVDMAREELDEAPRRYAAALTARAMGDDSAIPVPAKVIAERLRDAEQHLAAARESATEIQKLSNDAEMRIGSYREPDVKKAALAVLQTSPVIARVIEETEALQRAYIEKALELDLLVSKRLADLGTREGGNMWSRTTPAFTIANRFNSPPMTWRELLDTADRAGVARWEAALEALQRDASAPVPE
jgi:hypothetical protein